MWAAVLAVFAGCGRWGFDPTHEDGGLDPACVSRAADELTGPLAWSASFGTGARDETGQVAIDSNGDVIVSGHFEGELAIGDDIFTSNGLRDLFVAKLDPDGTVLWSKQLGGSGDDIHANIAIASDDAIFVQGEFACEATIEGQSWTTVEYPDCVGGSPTVWDIYAIVYEPDGSLRWFREFGGSDDFIGGDIAAAPDGQAVVAGHHKGSIDLGDGLHTSPSETYQAVVFKFDATELWSRSFGGDGFEGLNSVAMTDTGMFYVAGNFGGTIDFGDGTFLFNPGGGLQNDVLVLKYASDGTRLWERAYGSPVPDAGNDVALAGDDIVVVGSFGDTFTAAAQSLTTRGADDGFVLRLDADGVVQDLAQLGGAGNDTLNAAALRAGEIVVAGSFEQTIDVGSDRLASAGARDALVAAFSPNGTPLRALAVGGGGDDIALDILTTPDGRLAIVGTASSGATIANEVLPNSGQADGFLALFCEQLCDGRCVRP